MEIAVRRLARRPPLIASWERADPADVAPEGEAVITLRCTPEMAELIREGFAEHSMQYDLRGARELQQVAVDIFAAFGEVDAALTDAENEQP